MSEPRILTIGSANIDLVANVAVIPVAGQTLKQRKGYELTPGGKGANTALTVARLGGESIFCAKLGNDTYGAKLTGIYEENDINTRFVTARQSERTGLAVVLVENNGNNRIILYPGANDRLLPEDAEEALTCYPDALIMQFEIPDDTVITAARCARAVNSVIVVDAGPASKDFPLEKLGEIDIFSPNETETYEYTGIYPTTPETCLKACIALSARVHAKYYVLKLGERGVYLYDGKFFRVIAPYNVDVVDTTGAGDVFTAAMTMEYIRSYDIRRACEFGNIAAAMSITKKGAYLASPTHEEICDYIKQNNIDFKI